MGKYQDGKSDFKVIIVGGAVAGLTLAHCLDRANIDYILLERRDEVAPAWGSGAAQAVGANGARILDQLHLLEAIEEVSTEWSSTKVIKADGKLLMKTNAVMLIEQRLGYKTYMLERRLLLQTLYNTQRDQSRILLNKSVEDVIHSSTGVVVSCSDGTTYAGDIIIGADGIHSKIRTLLRERIYNLGSGHLLRSDVHCITSEFGGIYGISVLPEDIQKDVEIGVFSRTMDKGRSGFCVPLKDGRTAWVLCIQFPHRLPEELVQRFTTSDMEKQVAAHGDMHLNSRITVKDLYKHATVARFVPFEEASMDVWTWDRFACIGDAVHKMTPNFGQGSNQAMESAAVLSNCLDTMLAYSNGKPTASEIKVTLESYQNQRKGRAQMITQRANFLSNLEAQTSLVGRIKGAVQSIFIDDYFAGVSVDALIGAPCLEFLPNPPKALIATLGFDLNSGNGKKESKLLRALRASPLILLFFLARSNAGLLLDQTCSLLQSHANVGDDASIQESWSRLNRVVNYLRILGGRFVLHLEMSNPLNRLQMIGLIATLLPVMIIWWIESIRRGNSFTIASVFAPLFCGIMYQYLGISVVVPLYCLFHYTQSPVFIYMAQDLRMVNISRIKTLVPAVMIGFMLPIIAIVSPAVSASTRQLAEIAWQFHPLTISILSFVFSKCLKDTTAVDRIRNPKADIVYLRVAYAFAFVLASSVHLWLKGATSSSVGDLVLSYVEDARASFGSLSGVSLQFFGSDQTGSLSAMLYWTLLHVGDLKGKDLVGTNWLAVLATMVSMTLIFGPGACVVAFWAWREEVLCGWRMASSLTV